MTRSLTSAERAADALRELILGGDLAPGARLGEVELAERLGVSRTPVREALSRLAAEGLVEISPNRGARVTTWTVAELEGVFDLRSTLEPQLTALAVPHATADDVAELDDLARMRRRRRPGRARTSTRSSRSTARSTTGWSPSPTTPRWPPRWPAAIHPPIVLRNFHTYDEASLAAASPTTSRSSPRCGPATPRGRAAVMTAHIHNARAVMVRGGIHRAARHRSDHGASYRLGVDVGGTFTDVLLVDEDSGATWRPRPPPPRGPGGRRPHRHRQGLRRGRDRAARGRPGAARHHGRHQRDPRGQGRHRRPGHHQGLPAGAADRPLLRPRRAGRLDHLAQARAAGRAGEHRRGRRADRQRRHGRPRARRGRRPRALGASSPAAASRRSRSA